VKQRKSSVEHGVTCDRRDRKVRLEIAGREADGGRRCVSVGCGTAQAGPPLDSRCEPAQAVASAQARVEYCLLVCRCGGRGTKRAPLGRATVHLHARGVGWRAFHLTRLGTRTKESNMCSSRWVCKPARRKEADGREPLSMGCIADRP